MRTVKILLMQRAVLCLGLGVALGCSHGSQDRLTGSWSSKMALNGTQIAEQVTYKPDGTYSSSYIASRPGTRVSLHVSDVGTWKSLGGNHYAQHLTDTVWVTEGAATPEGAAKAEARFKKKKAWIIANANKDPAFTVKWLSDDTYALAKGDLIETFTRQR